MQTNNALSLPTWFCNAKHLQVVMKTAEKENILKKTKN